MKKIFFISSIVLFSFITLIIIVLSTVGFETDKFNKLIADKATENNNNILLDLEKVNFKLDVKKLNLFLETKNPKLTYKDLQIPILRVKVYLNFHSLIRSKSKIDKIYIESKEIRIDQLKKIINKTKPSNFNSLVNNNLEDGKIFVNLELFFDDNLKIKNFIAKGEAQELAGIINKNLSIKNMSFDFFGDSSDILIKNLKSKMEGLIVENGNIQIKKDKKISLKSDFKSRVDINRENIVNYLPLLKNIEFINLDTNINAILDNFFNITFDKTFKIIEYDYSNKGKINNLSIRLNKPIKNLFLEKDINDMYLKNSSLNTRFASDKKNYVNSIGKYSIDNQNFQDYEFKNNFSNESSNINLELEILPKIKIDIINYKKDDKKPAKIFLDFITKKNFINLRELKYTENQNLIFVQKLKINNKDLVSVNKIKIKTYDNKNLKNDFSVSFGNKINISGNKYDAKNINKYLNQKSKNNFLKKINKDIEINFKNIDTPLSQKLKNFRLLGAIEKGKFVKISSKGDFGDNKFLDISMKNDKLNNKKFLEVYSDLPQPLLSEYNFFKGLSEGVLTFSSIIEEKTSISKLMIEDFKVVNAPGVVKLLSLADFGGLADLAEGDGLSFEKMEISMSTDKGFLKLSELYAVGPSISVLMEGYKEENGLTSLRGTLVPAKNLNKLLSKIPVIGKIIIPKEIGEGLFGVSFKIKGMPGKMKTTINPIKTLTPRFITKALEKQKRTK